MMSAMRKEIYIAPEIALVPFKEPVMDIVNYQSGYNANDEMDPAKRHKWHSWDDDDDVTPVGSTVGTGKSALELPSGGKLWDD